MGNANAFTGEHGHNAVPIKWHWLMHLASARIKFCWHQPELLANRLNSKLSAYFSQLVANQGASWEQAAGAILTTDTFPKGAHVTCDINGVSINICGIAKGSGMIAPNMATMLGYIATDATLPADVLQTLLTTATNRSFNAITVDSDTSTNDTVFLVATGRTNTPVITSDNDPKLAGFRDALTKLMVDLAPQIVRDGEGAKNSSLSPSVAPAQIIRLIILVWPLPPSLVKTAIAGEDANWDGLLWQLANLVLASTNGRLT